MEPAGDTRFRTIGDPVLDDEMEATLTKGVEALLTHSQIVVLTTSPYIDSGRVDGKSPATPAPESDHARMDRLNLIIRSVAAKFPRVALIDLNKYVAEQPDDDQASSPTACTSPSPPRSLSPTSWVRPSSPSIPSLARPRCRPETTAHHQASQDLARGQADRRRRGRRRGAPPQPRSGSAAHAAPDPAASKVANPVSASRGSGGVGTEQEEQPREA